VEPEHLQGELARALDGLDVPTRQALGRALERGAFELDGGDWGEREDGAGCLLSLAAWEMGYERGETLMRRSVDAVRIPALFDAWWDEVIAREGDVVRARRTVRETVGAMLHRSLGEPPPLDAQRLRGESRESVAYPTK
jgi:hypothetical protein